MTYLLWLRYVFNFCLVVNNKHWKNLCQTGVALEGQIHWAKKSITYFFFSFNFERKKWPFSMHILYEKSHWVFSVYTLFLYPECTLILKVYLMCQLTTCWCLWYLTKSLMQIIFWPIFIKCDLKKISSSSTKL